MERAATQKAKTIQAITEKKILTNLKLLPNTRKVALENEQQRTNRIMIKEAKENMWKRWRGKVPMSRKNTNLSEQERLEEKLSRIEREIESWRNEEKDRKEQEERELQRREKYIEEKKEKENTRIIKEKAKKEKLKRKKELEKHWEILRWLIEFIDENKEQWEENDNVRELENEQREREKAWRALGDKEKESELKKEEKEKEMSREEKIELAKKKRAGWREWRDPPALIPPFLPSRKRILDEENSQLRPKPAKRFKASTVELSSRLDDLKLRPTQSQGPPDFQGYKPIKTKLKFKHFLRKAISRIEILKHIPEESSRWGKQLARGPTPETRVRGGGGNPEKMDEASPHHPSTKVTEKRNPKIDKFEPKNQKRKFEEYFKPKVTSEKAKIPPEAHSSTTKSQKTTSSTEDLSKLNKQCKVKGTKVGNLLKNFQQAERK